MFSLVLTCFFLSYVQSANSLWHVTPPRHVSVYVRMGHTFDEISVPGVHAVSPLTYAYDFLVEEDIDTVRNVVCGTNDGITLIFPSIDITNRLPAEHVASIFSRYGIDYDSFTIYKNVNAFIGQICAGMSAEEVYIKNFTDIDDKLKDLLIKHHETEKTGIEIKMVKVYKPYAKDSDIIQKFKQRAEHEANRKALIVKNEEQKQFNTNELLKKKGLDDLAKQENAARISRELDNKNGEAERQTIELQMETQLANNKAAITQIEANAKAMKLKTEGDAQAFTIKQIGDALTPEYVKMKLGEASMNNAKMIIGNEIPDNGWINMGSTVDSKTTAKISSEHQ